jgi:hypothetical protein
MGNSKRKVCVYIYAFLKGGFCHISNLCCNYSIGNRFLCFANFSPVDGKTTDVGIDFF